MINYEYYRAHQLPVEVWSRWAEIIDGQPALDRPFLRPEFTRYIASVRDDVEVSVIKNGPEVVGIFPWQRNGSTAHAVVGRLSECHGAIVEEGIDWDPLALFRTCGIDSWHFDHLPESQSKFTPFAWGQKASPYVNLAGGYEAYRAKKRKESSSFASIERKARKLEREHGALTFRWNDESPDTVAKLMEWKSEQHRRTKVLEIFKYPWVGEMLKAKDRFSTDRFSAPLSTLRVNDQLVAVHLGLCTQSHLHCWFPAFDVSFGRYSPGLIMMIRIIEAATERGNGVFEFGPGEEQYKQQLKTGDFEISEGIVRSPGVVAASRQLWFQTKQSIRNSRYRNCLEVPLTATKRLRQWIAFRH